MANVLGTLFGDIADAIRAKSGESGTMKPAEFPAKIAAIPAGGGGSAAGAVTVTFCNYDGTELYSRQVFIGDDCPDPVTQGKMPIPTRESTAQYDYTYNGWSATADGTASTSALKNITADTTVYAAYSSTVRKYTVRFYDGDTLMKTEQVAYGSKATPPDTTKDGHVFSYWTPNDLTVRGDTDFVGTWVEATYTLIDIPDDLKARVTALGVNPINDNIVLVESDTASSTAYLRACDVNGESAQTLFSMSTGSSNGYGKIIYNHDGTRMALHKNKFNSNSIQIYDTTTTPYTILGIINVVKNVRSMAYSPDNNKLLVGCDTDYFVTYDATQFPYVLTDDVLSWEHSGAVNQMAYNADKTILALGSVTAKKACFYDTTTTPYTLIATYSYNAGVYGIAFSPDGKECIVSVEASISSNTTKDFAYLYHINGKSITTSEINPFKYTAPDFGANVKCDVRYHPNGGKILFNDTSPSEFGKDILLLYNANSYTRVQDMFYDPPRRDADFVTYNKDGSRLILICEGLYADFSLRIYNTEIDMV
jgi:WD40 repeat protein